MNDLKKSITVLLSSLDLVEQSVYEDGEFSNLLISKNNLKWDFYLKFPDVLKIKDVIKLKEEIIKKFKNEGIEEINVNINYPNKTIDNKTLEGYYFYFLNNNIEKKARYSALKVFSTSFENNKIQFYVADEHGMDTCNELLGIIMEDFKLYNLDFVSSNVSVSPFEVPMEKIIKDNLDSSNQVALKNQELYDLSIGEKKTEEKKKTKTFKRKKASAEINGEVISLDLVPASEVEVIEYTQKNGSNNFVVQGEVIEAEILQRKSFKLYEGTIYDGTNSIVIKTFLNSFNANEEDFYNLHCMKGGFVKVFGYVEYDKYSRDVVLRIKDIIGLEKETKTKIGDNAPIKRVELHAHTKMSSQDGVMDVYEYVNRAKELGHSAIAVTDHYNVQALPDLYQATKRTDVKAIYGLEGALINEARFKIAYTNDEIDLRAASFVVFDLETTGFSSNYNEIIEIAAVKIKSGQIIDEFSCFVKPKRSIPAKITKLTSITNDDVRLARGIKEEITDFSKFIEDSVLVAQNASFDLSFLYKNLKDHGLYIRDFPALDTMTIAKVRYSKVLKSYNLKALSKYFDIPLTNHHRAIADARATGGIFIKMLQDLFNKKIYYYQDLNSLIDSKLIHTMEFAKHVTILSKSKEGLKNLYKIVTDSNTSRFYKSPKIMKSFLEEQRKGLLIGSSCYKGEVFELALNNSFDLLLEAVEFYDYLEVQPASYYRHMFDGGDAEYEMEIIEDTIKKIIKAGRLKNITVVATGDVHILSREDYQFREIFFDAPQVGGGLHELHKKQNIAPQHYMTTEEMLKEFEFLGEDLAYEIVVKNTNLISDKIEKYPLFPDELYAPRDDFMKDKGVGSFKQAVNELTYFNAKKIYGEDLPRYIGDRITKELDSIIGNNYASIYYISHLLVKHSIDAGYAVGSRGSVGSSLVAFFMGITEVNALVPHYFCPKCHFTSFKWNKEDKGNYLQTDEANALDSILQSVGSGFDLPERECPACNSQLLKDGVDIPFETFLGFDGDKVPDIDLNFSGEYQSRAHDFCRDLFGHDRAFRAGTISTIADRTAFGYVKSYLERKEISARSCEVKRLASKITGVKRSTGQHPGGIVVVPKEIEVTDITPVQYPADDIKSSWMTTHFDYHKFESNLLKLDILGHDDPTMIRHLMDFVEAEPEKFPFKSVDEIPIYDADVISIFSGLSSLGVDATMVSEVVGTTGIPEFGTTLAKEMLVDIRPKTVNELIKISGLSHGTDVWRGNARDYMLGLKPGVGPIAFKDLIGCRDDIMVYLVAKGLPKIDAFKIMESVRKGRGLSSDQEKQMLSFGVPAWYIDSCKLIKYMFPKAHAAAYVIMALRIAWFKVHRPLYYYAAYFSRRANAFDVTSLAKGYDSVNVKVKELQHKIETKQATNKEIDVHYTLTLGLEMLARGYSFKQINIKKSDWRDFLIEDNSLIIPFRAMDSLGEVSAKSITDARSEKMFSSKKDVLRRTKINTTVYEKLNQIDAFVNLPNDDQLGLF